MEAAARGLTTKRENKFVLAVEACEKADYNPFDELISLATDKKEMVIGGETVEVFKASVDQRIAIAKELASYLAPKVKNESGKNEDNSFHITINRFESSLKEALEAK